MDNSNHMSRLILVPQYPTRLRYQEWWWEEFPEQFKKYFNEVVVLGGKISTIMADAGIFSPVDLAITYETRQIWNYMDLELRKDDVLLLNDLSFPGLFANVLFHKRPSKCFAICHATSKNRYDYFAKDRKYKYPIEKSTAKLFNKIFVASQYHANKLNWSNLIVQPFPYPPYTELELACPASILKEHTIVSVSRTGIQKRNLKLERKVERTNYTKIETCTVDNWRDYLNFLAKSRALIITAKEETYGYQVIDAISNDCIPIAPNKLSYPELLPKEYLYNSYEELEKIVARALLRLLPVPKLLIQEQAKAFYSNLARYMQE